MHRADQPAPFVIVINDRSGHNDSGDIRRRIEERLTAANRTFAFESIDNASRIAIHAQRAALHARETAGIIVAVGGDGTINAVAAAALRSGVPLAVLPQGTFNFFGRDHGIPSELDAGIDVLVNGRLQTVQVGRVNDRPFLVNASVGLYPELLEERESWKRRFGRSRLVAFGAGLATLLRGYRPLRLDIVEGDGTTRQLLTPTLVAGNNALQLERLGIADAPVIGIGQLVAIAPRPVSRWRMLGLALRGAFGHLGDAERIDSFGFERLVVQPYGRRRRHKLAIDGEIVHLDAPLLFQAQPDALHLLLPQPGDEAPRE